jgi:hypothetical protein
MMELTAENVSKVVVAWRCSILRREHLSSTGSIGRGVRWLLL